jgi:hypothetical protein
MSCVCELSIIHNILQSSYICGMNGVNEIHPSSLTFAYSHHNKQLELSKQGQKSHVDALILELFSLSRILQTNLQQITVLI